MLRGLDNLGAGADLLVGEVLAEIVRLSRLAGAAQCRFAAGTSATEELSRIMRASAALEGALRAWRAEGAPGEGDPARRLARQLREAAVVRIRAVTPLNGLRRLEPLERFDCDAPLPDLAAMLDTVR